MSGRSQDIRLSETSCSATSSFYSLFYVVIGIRHSVEVVQYSACVRYRAEFRGCYIWLRIAPTKSVRKKEWQNQRLEM
ncbi:hypothetical protein CEXT_23971 [Caerostris extrusa]|uniref:Uncharacterized protein n=1 Tax=Caerostris extrusa TaxID=172846 RepID=A0AAV4NV08_CAEEX|nr:hypothetical protein CEXT_23971 [Caerostris extrusa]